MTTGQRMNERRKQLGISADTLAEKLGVSRSTIFRYESGAIEKMPIDIIKPIAAALHTTVEYLLGMDVPMQSQISDSTQNTIDVSEDEFTYAMYNEGKDLTPEQKQSVLDMVRFLKSQNDKE